MYGDDYEEDGGEDFCRRCNRACEECVCDGDEEDGGDEFADPGGESALRAETEHNPRNLPCPTCHGANRLTPKDAALGYQCDACATACERGVDRDLVCGEDCPLCKDDD